MKVMSEEMQIQDFEVWTTYTKQSHQNMWEFLHNQERFKQLTTPQIVLIQDYIILQELYDEALLNDWIIDCHQHKQCVEQAVNICAVLDLFPTLEQNDLSKTDLKVLGEIIRKFWAKSFLERYGDRGIIVDLIEDEEHYFLSVYEVQI
ncbi:hypothetical protein [Longirhabdus pacifica]|uniref:hypothetical protein n=1 Tax=Longirhabdus pacifica TaxID=2305227 RepID=UPI001009277C|nr:hypothetical protein [Longirhabdus pacifica]